MADEVADLRAIEKHADRLLAHADARGKLPTPVDDLVAAAGLVQPKQSLLGDLVLRDAPQHLRRPIRRLRFKIRALLDRQEREIHLDPTIDNPGQIAFKTLHEVGHDILPWQQALGYADDDESFAPDTRVLFERQANVCGAELLFQRDLFADMAHDSAIGLAVAFDLATRFGSSRRAALRRYAETHRGAVAGLVLENSPIGPEQLAYRRREMVCSRTFTETFGAHPWPRVLRSPPYTFLADAANALTSQHVAVGRLVLPDVNNVCHELHVEISSNYYNLLVLIWIPRRETGRRRLILVSQSA